MTFLRAASYFVSTGLAGRKANCARLAALAPVAVVLSALATGCATGEYAYVTTISTGERIQIPLNKGIPEPAKKGPITIKHAGLVPNPNPQDKQLKYLFDLEDKSPVPAKSIVVEDVTDDRAIRMVEDLAPKYVDQRWFGTSRLLKADDPELEWVGHLDNTTRVFRFTVTAANGSKIVLDQAWMAPSWAKIGMREALGIKLK